jgi:malate dehydrogenase (oxaloacetate-decarboxylating)
MGQANNAFHYLGLGLGTIVARDQNISDGMLVSEAKAVASLVDICIYLDHLLPLVENLHTVSTATAVEITKKMKMKVYIV